MKTFFLAISLFLCWVSAVFATTCNYASDCGIDGRCWTCTRSRQCVVNTRAIGSVCDDKNPVTIYDKCLSDGTCIGRKEKEKIIFLVD